LCSIASCLEAVEQQGCHITPTCLALPVLWHAALVSLGRGTAAKPTISRGSDLAVVCCILLFTSPVPSRLEGVGGLKGTAGLLAMRVSRTASTWVRGKQGARGDYSAGMEVTANTVYFLRVSCDTLQRVQKTAWPRHRVKLTRSQQDISPDPSGRSQVSEVIHNCKCVTAAPKRQLQGCSLGRFAI